MLENIEYPKFIKNIGLKKPYINAKKNTMYGLYKCECGNTFEAIVSKVKIKHIQSCGCLRIKKITKHNLRYHKIYSVWKRIKRDCLNIKSPNYKYYGERGITVCDKWLKFDFFAKDMLSDWKDGLTLDRIDNNKGYYKDNCRWTTRTVQARNTRVLQCNNTSGYRGVTFNKQRNKWLSVVKICNKAISLGSFDTAKEAGIAFNKYITDNNLEHTINEV